MSQLCGFVVGSEQRLCGSCRSVCPFPMKVPGIQNAAAVVALRSTAAIHFLDAAGCSCICLGSKLSSARLAEMIVLIVHAWYNLHA